jgi:hypothetical protein
MLPPLCTSENTGALLAVLTPSGDYVDVACSTKCASCSGSIDNCD